ncbi:nucleoside diphosphate kinase regulator [Gilvimarinus algae]|uniref:Nucleoside diphosphate kinase regulator n=1 Tax=Gilvimarinus algae TaxID=3058037 RepID=A0ABT8TBZ5_9GAMM|nr:nucleoside diphosphate kinase regulator [Gilvimarinus sp. SDUM040014]MDO3381114.1 nucleoside diphosphate kinase regulator [Gilvimarinus sp. SDUM040014]
MPRKPSIMVAQDVYDTLCRMIDARDGDAAAEQLLNELERARRVKPAKLPEDVVTVNSKVTFTIQETGKTFTYQLVYPGDAGKHDEALSVFSPAGSALLGLRTGQSIDWSLKQGQKNTIEVNRVEPPEITAN